MPRGQRESTYVAERPVRNNYYDTRDDIPHATSGTISSGRLRTPQTLDTQNLSPRDSWSPSSQPGVLGSPAGSNSTFSRSPSRERITNDNEAQILKERERKWGTGLPVPSLPAPKSKNYMGRHIKAEIENPKSSTGALAIEIHSDATSGVKSPDPTLETSGDTTGQLMANMDSISPTVDPPSLPSSSTVALEPHQVAHHQRVEIKSSPSSSISNTVHDVPGINPSPAPLPHVIVTPETSLALNSVSTLSSPPTTPQNNPISRSMAAQDVVSHLVAHGCKDLSSELLLSSFGTYPISHGGFSDVYKGQTTDGRKVALKALRVSAETLSQNPKHLKHAARELHTWGKCQHPNVIPLLGLATFRGRIGMVAPWMGNGTLPRYLERVPGVDRLKMCIQICEGLSYLHQIQIVHCDLKGANVLVSDEGNPVLTDFGNSSLSDRTLGFTQTTSGPSFTLRWSAAEIIEETSSHTKASDVYALGMTIYETMTSKVPYYGRSEPTVIRLVTEGVEYPERTGWMSSDDKNSDTLWSLLVRCWSLEPSNRPSSAEVTEIVSRLK